MNELKQRHGCITSFLWFAILVNLGISFYYSILMFNAYTSLTSLGFGLLGIMGIINVLASILLMRWNKLGYYIFLINSLVALIVNIGLIKIPVTTALISTSGIIIWWAILQIRKNGTSAWKLMDNGWDWKHCRHLYQVFMGIITLLLLLTVIATFSDHEGNPYEKMLKEYEDSWNVDSIAIEEENDSIVSIKEPLTTNDDEIEWKIFTDSTNAVRIEAPSDFRKVKLNTDQLMSLLCSDFDPAISIVQESTASLEAVGIETTKQYAQLVLKVLENSVGSDFKKISEKPYSNNSYLIECKSTIEGTSFYYKIIASKTKEYFYYCMVYCIDSYKYKLEEQINHIVNSFEALK